MVAFCKKRGIEPLAVYYLGPDAEDMSHVSTIWRQGFFRPERCLLVLNEGIIRNGKSVVGAFERTTKSPEFEEIVKEGAKPILVNRLPVMDQVKATGKGFYAAASGEAQLDPVEEFMVETWVEDLMAKRDRIGVSSWLP